MIISILLTYGIIMCWWCYSWLRNNIKLKISNNKQLIINIILVMLFIGIFIIFIRLLNLFRQSKTLDLNLIDFNLNIYLILLFIIFAYSLRRLLVYFFKLMWFRLHYFLLSSQNLPKFYKIYTIFYIDYIYIFFTKIYIYLKILRIFFVLGLVFFFFYDLVCNHGVMDKSLVYLRYYSIFTILYLVSKFKYEKQNLILDYYFQNLSYTLDPEHPFQSIKCSTHINIMELAIDYKNNMIFEYGSYKAEKINFTENAYFDYLNNKYPINYIKVIPVDQMFGIKNP